MNTYTAHLINAVTLIFMGGWCFFATQSKALFLPLLLGVVLLSITNGVKFKTRPVIIVAAVVTILCLALLIMRPLGKALDSYSLMHKIRIISMVATSALATLFFIIEITNIWIIPKK